MRNKCKKILSLLAAATLLGSTFALTSCGESYTQKALDGYVSSNNAAVSNGGFAVEKDGYVYFINGSEDYTAENKYGDVVKGALMRIASADLAKGDYSKVDTVVPMLFVAQNFSSGIYIYGDYVYYATPTTDKNRDNAVENSWLDFKSAKLDGSEAMKDYYFRLSSNSTAYRYVEVDGVVYCMYEEDGALKSYNTETRKTTVLVEGAEKFFYDTKDLTNPNVYYTMAVKYDIATEVETTASYNQIYCVNAASTASVNANEASYDVMVGGQKYRTYDFDKARLETLNEEAKETAKKNGTDYQATYVFDDYTTYPYVNLGTLVLDGAGSECKDTPYNDEAYKATAREELQGYTYTVTRYENGGVYYTRKEVTTNNNLYYLPETTEARDTVKANSEADVVAKNTTNASDTALFDVKTENGVRTHTYVYLSGSAVYRAETGVEEDVKVLASVSSPTLWKLQGDYLYYYASGTNSVTGDSTSGYTLSRVNYKGTKDDYHPILTLNAETEYKPLTINYVDFASSWYMPEMFGDVLLYANAQSVGEKSYNYIYATSLTTEAIKANNEAYEAVYKHIEEDFGDDTELNAALVYYYRVGTQEAAKNVEELYEQGLYTKEQYEESFTAFVKDIADNKYVTESKLISLLGEMKSDDVDAMAEAWEETLPHEHADDTNDEKTSWLVWVLVGAGVVVIAAAVVIIVIVANKKKAEKAEAEATVNAYKRKKIDTTDDKSIDVYADDEAEKTEE